MLELPYMSSTSEAEHEYTDSDSEAERSDAEVYSVCIKICLNCCIMYFAWWVNSYYISNSHQSVCWHKGSYKSLQTHKLMELILYMQPKPMFAHLKIEKKEEPLPIPFELSQGRDGGIKCQ